MVPHRARPGVRPLLRAGLGLLLLLAGCDRRGRPSVLLVTLDTVRADHLGCYGYSRPTSPHLDAFARAATLYTRALAAAPWTVPTHASLFTGRYPFEHGAHTVAVESPTNNVRPLGADLPTLAEVLHGQGYATAGFVANYAFLSPFWGLSRGFESYQVERTTADRLNRRVLAWLDARDRRPFFLFVNYIDVHRPYNTRPRPGLLPAPAVQDQGELLDRLKESVLPGAAPVSQALAGQVIDQYDTAIANVDEGLGELLDALRRSGRYDDTIIVVTSDHGEFFGEHQLVEHSKDVYDPVLRVPLVVKLPGQRRGKRDDTIVSSPDLPSIILSAIAGTDTGAARELKRYSPGSHPVIAENYYTRVNDLFDPRWGHRFNRIRVAYWEWPYKYIHSSDGQHELYELERDRDERENLTGLEPEVAARMAIALARFRTEPATGEDEAPSIGEQETERLRALGYVGH